MKDRDGGNLFDLDQGFPERVFDTSLFLGVLLIVCCASFGSLRVTLSLAAGVAISLVFCRLLWWSIRRLVRPGMVGQKPAFLMLGIIKYAALGVALFVMFRRYDVHVIALFAGLSVVQVVIVLKFLSLLLVDSLNRSIKVSDTGRCTGHLTGKDM